jgi:ATP-dependent RNA helicase RhlE
MSSQTFADLGVSEVAAAALARRDIHTPFAVQTSVIPDVLAGHDVLVKSPTGSGKTLAFGVPMLERIQATDRRPSALVLAPTRELAGQNVEDLREVAHARALSIAAVYGGAGIVKQARLAARAHVLVATPGRLLDLIERRDVTLANIKLLVLDEADRMLDMGFRPVVDRIVRMIPERGQTLLFSATLEGEVGRIAAAYTSNPRRHEHAATETHREQTEHRFVRVAHQGKVDQLIHELADTQRGRTLIFVRTKRGADRLVKRLASRDVHALAMHGDKSQSQRERALSRFASGRIDTLVATDVAARGIDVSGITHVINFDVPGTREDYVHRVGRTARAGASGVGITFVSDDQAREFAGMVSDLDLRRQLESGGVLSSRSENGRPENGRPKDGRRQGQPRSNRPAGQGPGSRPGSRQRRRRAPRRASAGPS